MTEYKVGDWVFDVLLDDVVKYHSGYDNLSDAHKDMVLRHATPKEIEEIKAGKRLCTHSMTEITVFGDLKRIYECGKCGHKEYEEWVSHD